MRLTRKEIGNLGEDIAVRFLEGRGYEIVERNYLRKWGEIDVVAKNGGILHFVEVKTISREISDNISRGTFDVYAPEDNVHVQKLKRLNRAIQTYLEDRSIDGNWQLDVVTVLLDTKSKKAQCRFLDNVL
jgi:putative endonuclease